MKVMLVGPIKHWWDVWDSPEHKHYVAWREAVSKALVDAGHLVYRPHEAWKGQWDESAQLVNDIAMNTVDVLVNLTPPEVPSLGTDDEIDYARRYDKPVLLAQPPPHSDYTYWAERDVERLARFMEGQVEGENKTLAKVTRDLLWVLDSETPRESSIVKDIIQEAREALGVATKGKP